MKEKIISLFLSVMLLITAFAPLQLTVGALSEIWNGTQSEPKRGSGDSDDPIKITNAAELAWLVNQTDAATSGRYYKLTADIKLNEIESIKGETATPWFAQNEAADNTVAFGGHFDGGGHTVSGLYFNDRFNSSQSNMAYYSLAVGLFPRLGAGAVIENLGITDSYIKALNICNGKEGAVIAAGLIAGAGYSTAENAIKISGCFADKTATVKSAAAAGGLIGIAKSSLIAENCYSSAVLETEYSMKGGIAGGINDAFTAVNCYSVGARLTREYWTETKFGYTNCYTTEEPITDGSGRGNPAGVTLLKSDEMLGVSSLSRMNLIGSPWGVKKYSRPYLKNIFTRYDPPTERFSEINGNKGEIWSGNIAEMYAGGDGATAATAFEIETPEQLARLVTSSGQETAGKYYKLTSDITINDTGKVNWQETAKSWFAQNDAADAATFFAGYFDGGGHTVSGLYFGDALNSYQNGLNYWSLGVGLFPTAEKATFKNVGIVNSQITAVDVKGNGEVSAGLLVGVGYSDVDNPIEISGCFTDESSSVESANCVGGLIGLVRNGSLSAKNCYSLAALKNRTEYNAQTGGIAGQVWKNFTAESCYSVGARLCKEYWVETVFNYTNCYTDFSMVINESPSGVTRLDFDEMIGRGAAEKMSLNTDVWRADDKYPILRVFAGENGDLNNDGNINAEDLIIMSKALLSDNTDEKYDVNKDKNINVLDLVRLKKLPNENIPVTVDISDYNYAGNDADILNAAFADVAGMSRGNSDRQYVLKLENRTYNLGKTLMIYGGNNITVEGNGASLIWGDLILALQIHNCTNVTLQNLSLDYDPLPFTQGVITEVNGTSVKLRIDEGYRTDIRNVLPQGNGYMTLHDRSDGAPLEGAANFYYPKNAEYLGGRDISFTIDWQDENAKKVAVGDVAALFNRGEKTVEIVNCSGTKFTSVNMYSSPGFLFNENDSDVCTVLTDCKIVPGPKPAGAAEERLRSANADAAHFGSVKTGPTFDNCTITHSGDDGLNIQGFFFHVVKVQGNNIWVTPKWDVGAYVGDTIEGYEKDSYDVLGTARITAYEKQYDPSLKEVIAAAYEGVAEGYQSEDLVYKLTLSRTLDFKVGDHITSLDRVSSGTVIKNCTFGYNTGRGVIIKGRNTVIRNNKFIRCCHSGIFVLADLNWCESGFPENVRISGNEIVNCGTCGVNLNSPSGTPGSIWVGVLPTSNVTGFMRNFNCKNIEIENNTVTDSQGYGIFATNCNGIKILNNTVNRPFINGLGNVGKSYGLSPVSGIFVGMSKNIEVSDNKVYGNGNISHAVQIYDNCEETFHESNNYFR